MDSDSESSDKYFSWLQVINTVEDRLKDDSLIHTFSCRNKIRESTKKLNKHLKTSRPKSHSDFVECKKDILSKLAINLDVSDDSDLSDSDFKTFYNSFNDSSAGTSKDVHDELFVWSFVEKKGLKTAEPEDEHDHSIWEPAIDISIADGHSQAEGQVKFNANFKAAGALPITNKFLRKTSTKKIHYNTRQSSSNNSINNNTNCNNLPKKTPEIHDEGEVEQIKTPATKVLRNKKINGVKRNLKSAINNASSRVSETGEADFTCDFIPEDFQAQSTQIFSDTFTDTSIRISNQTKQVHTFSSNHANHQPRDSGIDEDSRDENTPHQNIENNERKTLGDSKNKEQNSLSSENTETFNGSKKKQPLKIIGDETLTTKYKIIGKMDKVQQPIVEERNVPLSELNNKSNGCLNHESNNDSESDFKSIESGDEEESNGGEKAKESSDEYHDVPDDNNALSFEDENVSQPEESVVKNGRESSIESDFQDSKHHRKRLKNEALRSISPWVAKQYKDLERLRLLDTSQDDSEIDLNKKDKSNNNAEQKVSKKNNKTPKKLANKTEKLSENHIKSKKKKSFINGKLIKNLDSEMSNPRITNESSDKDENAEGHSTRKIESSSNKTERFIKNDNSSNSKLNSDNRDSSESDTADSHKSSQKIKKLKHRKKRQKTNRSDLPSSREQSYERQTQDSLTDIVKSHKDVNSSQSIKDDTKEEIHQSCEKNLHVGKSKKPKTKSVYNNSDCKENIDAICLKNNRSRSSSSAYSIKGLHQSCEEDLHVGKSKKQKTKSVYNNSDDSKENIDAICSKNNRSRSNSSASSIKDLSTNKQMKEIRLKNETLTTLTSDDEKESEDEKTMSEHQKKKLQKLKKMDLMASDESSVSETHFENVDSHNKNESSSITNDKPSEQIIEESYESNDEGIDNWKTTETVLPSKESPSNESDEEDDVLPTQQAQKKIQQMKRLNFDDSSESEDSEKETISINKHKSQFMKSEATKEQNKEKSEIIRKASSHEDSDEDDKMPEKEKKHLQQMKKMDLMASDESEDSDDHQVSKNISRKISDEKIKSNSPKEQTLNEKSEKTHRLSEEESDEEDTVLENKVKHLKKKKKMDIVLTDDSEDSDEGDQILKSRSRKISDDKVKSEDSEDEDKTSKKKVELQKKSIADSHNDSDSDSVHYDSDNVDIKEHKVTLPEELKHSNLLDHLNENNNIESFNTSVNDGKSEKNLQRKDLEGLDNYSDEEIDNIVPVEVSKRMQQLKRLNLYEDNDSSDSDESLKNNRNHRNTSQNPSSVSRKERDDRSSDEKENISEEPPISTDKLNESELNDTKESIEDEVAREKENGEKNMNVIIPETQENEDFVSDTIQSQEMFSSLENLAECSSQIPETQKSVSKKSTPTKPERVKITEISELVEQEELTKSSLEPTITLGDISDDEETFLIEVPKNVFDQDIVGKKLVVSNGTLTIGESNYEAFEKGSSPIISCVIKSKKKKFKTVNIRPLFSMIARRKKDAEDFDDNIEIENRHEKLTTNQHYTKESDQESVDAAYHTESTSTKKSKLKKPKSSHKDKLHSLSSTTLKDGTITKKKNSKSKKIKLNNVIDNIESLKEQTEQEITSPSKVLKRKLYASDHEMKDIDSNATDESCMIANNSSKKSKKKKNVNTSEKLTAGITEKESSLKNLNVKNEIATTSNHENKEEIEGAVQSKSKMKSKKKTKNKVEESNPQTAEESALEQIIKSREDNKKMFENMFQDSFLLNMSAVDEVQPVKKKAKKRKSPNGTNEDVNSDSKIKRRKKSTAEEAEESPVAIVKPKQSRKKIEKPKEEPPSVQIMKLINGAFNMKDDKHNTSTSSNESRYGALDIERVPAKKNYSSSSSSDESEKKYSKSLFCVREKSKEKESTKPTTSLNNNTPLKKEVKDEKKKVKKVYFDE